jgi:hypothetical protein
MAAVRFGIVLLAVALVTACSGALRSSFPTEEEVRAKLHRGMTADQVLATFGKPDGHQFIKFEFGGKLHYIAPPATRTAPEEGYAGFSVLFVKDQVWDWEVIRLKPSYEPRLLASRHGKWGIALLVLAFVGVVGTAAVRWAWLRRRERLEQAT